MQNEMEIIAPQPVIITVKEGDAVKKIILRPPGILQHQQIAERFDLSDTESPSAAQSIAMAIELISIVAREELPDGTVVPLCREWIENLPVGIANMLAEKINSVIVLANPAAESGEEGDAPLPEAIPSI